MLYKDGLIMYDRQTDTLWTQVDGLAIRGPLLGQRLEPVAAVHATWTQWKTLYPESLVLRKRGELRSRYSTYNRNRLELGIFGRRNEDDRLPGKERILGVAVDGAATAFPLSRLRRARLVQSTVGELPLALITPSPDDPVLAYDRRVGGRVLTFELSPDDWSTFRDVETRTEWRFSDGVAIRGPLQGHRLDRVAAHSAFWFGWRGYFPNTDVWRDEP